MIVEVVKKKQGFYYLDVTLDDHSLLCSLDLGVLKELHRNRRTEWLPTKVDLHLVEEIFELFMANAREGRY